MPQSEITIFKKVSKSAHLSKSSHFVFLICRNMHAADFGRHRMKINGRKSSRSLCVYVKKGIKYEINAKGRKEIVKLKIILYGKGV